MYLLDTNILSEFFKDNAKILAKIESLPDDTPFAISIVNLIEILKGRFEFLLKAANGEELIRADQWLREDLRRLDTIDRLPISDAVAELFDRHRQNRKMKNIGRPDLLIACVALAHGATLVTRNTKDFAGIPNLKLENWAA